MNSGVCAIGQARKPGQNRVDMLDDSIVMCDELLDGQSGETGVQIGVPCVIGAGGVEKIVEVGMTDDEFVAFKHSCEVVRGNVRIALSKSQNGVR